MRGSLEKPKPKIPESFPSRVTENVLNCHRKEL